MIGTWKIIAVIIVLISIESCSTADPEPKHQEPAKLDAKYKSALATIAKIDSINFALNWQEIKPGLWQSDKGDLGIKESRMIYLDSMLFVTDFIMKVDSLPMNNFINLPTFVRLSSNFYKDAYRVYHYYPMAYGGFFSVLDSADNNSFEIIGDCYARDINYIYSEKGDILENIDPLTFFSTKGAGCFAMDKNGFYFWGEPINEKDLAIEEIQYVELLKKKFNDPDTLFSEPPGYQLSPSQGKTKIKFSNFSLTINSLFEDHNLHKDTVLIFEEVGEYLVGRELIINSKDPSDTFKLYIQSVDYVHELIKSDSTGYVGDWETWQPLHFIDTSGLFYWKPKTPNHYIFPNIGFNSRLTATRIRQFGFSDTTYWYHGEMSGTYYGKAWLYEGHIVDYWIYNAFVKIERYNNGLKDVKWLKLEFSYGC